MKPRVRIDSSLGIFALALTGVFHFFPSLYFISRGVDYCLDFVGLFLILEGSVLRMVARGHKRAHSGSSTQLVTTGPYNIVRNPMYVGTLLIGCGFVLILWPWWMLPLFVFVFYKRFIKQILLEEEYWRNTLPQEYAQYCQEVPRLIPSVENLSRMDLNEITNRSQMLSTKEKWGIVSWPSAAFVLELWHNSKLWGDVQFFQTATIFIVGIGLYAIGFFFVEQTARGSNEQDSGDL